MAKGTIELGSGGVSAGLALVLLLGPGGCGGGEPRGSPASPGVSGLYIAATGPDGREPWVLRRPSLLPVKLGDINPGGAGSDPGELAAL